MSHIPYYGEDAQERARPRPEPRAEEAHPEERRSREERFFGPYRHLFL